MSTNTSASHAASSFLSRYWVDSPAKFYARIDEIVAGSQGAVEPFELCKSGSGVPVPGYRIGGGPTQVVLLGRVHGHEPSGTCGLTSLIDGLIRGVAPDTGDRFRASEEILRQFTLHVFPLVNPTAAERYCAQIPDSYIGEMAATARREGRYEEWLHRDYVPILHEPGVTLNKMRPPFYTTEELAVLGESGRTLGTLFTEDGVELWKDWRYGRAPQTRALQAYLQSIRPALLVDVHNDSPPTRICPPSDVAPGDRDRYMRLGEAAYSALRAAGIECSDSVEPYLKIDDHNSVSWAYDNLGTTQFLYEINGLGSKEHMALAVWYGIVGVLLAAGQGDLRSS